MRRGDGQRVAMDLIRGLDLDAGYDVVRDDGQSEHVTRSGVRRIVALSTGHEIDAETGEIAMVLAGRRLRVRGRRP